MTCFLSIKGVLRIQVFNPKRNMSPEASTLQDPEALRRQLFFDNLLPAALVLEERHRVGSKSTWDKFMHDCYGHPEYQDYKDIRHPSKPENARSFPFRIFDGYAPEEGTIMVMRASTAAPSAPEDYILFTGDLYEEKITAWSVTEISADGNGQKQFILSDSATDSERAGNLYAVPDHTLHPVRLVAEGIRLARAAAVELARRPRLIWGPQMRAFQKPDGPPEILAGRIAYLHKAILAYEEAQRISAAETWTQEEPGQEPQLAATIAAA